MTATNKSSGQAKILKKTDGTKPPRDYTQVLTETVQLIKTARQRALATVNREMVVLYWQIGRVIVHQQERAKWGDAVVVRLALDLRAEFPEMKGLSQDNLWRMRQFFLAMREIDQWLQTDPSPKLGTTSRVPDQEIVGTLSREFKSSDIPTLILGLSWSHQVSILGRCETPAERYFYMQLGIRERWSVRQLRRQIDADLFTRYVSVSSHPEKCLPAKAESGDLLPFKNHYVLEFLGLEDQHSEQELRQAILANLRDFFLEFGKDLTFVGEEYPLTVGNDTFYIDLVFFHRRLQCLIAIELKKGKFKPEYAGKSRFYCAALDEYIKLSHENPSLGLVLCRHADAVQVRLALTEAAEKVGVATYQTALPSERLIRQRLKQLPELSQEEE